MTNYKNSHNTAATGLGSVAAVCFLLFVMMTVFGVPTASADTLSNETTLSRWAYTNDIVKVKTSPGGGRIITRTRWQTEDRLPELYLALKSVRENGRVYVKIRLPRRPNNSTGWVPRSALGNYHRVRKQLVIDRASFRATLYKGNNVVWRGRIGIGKRGTPTPRGNFYVREKLRGFNNPIYGPRVFALSAYAPGLTDWPGGGIIGIHGTNQPGILPGRVSHGCIRLKNSSILALYKRMPLGTPVLIN